MHISVSFIFLAIVKKGKKCVAQYVVVCLSDNRGSSAFPWHQKGFYSGFIQDYLALTFKRQAYNFNDFH